MITEKVRRHYEEYPYPHYPLLATVPSGDTYHLSLKALWSYFNHALPPQTASRILIAGCGSFAPYPFAVANPDAEIVALDLSAQSLKRARLHCLLHGNRNVRFEAGNLCDPAHATGSFGMIDAFGVLHHLDNPLAGLRSLEKRLAPGGIMRIMLYSRYARREEESIRRALRILKINDVAGIKKLLRRSGSRSRLRCYAATSPEANHDSGLADALLHPCVHTYMIDDILELVRNAGLVPLRFAHAGAFAEPDAEIERLRTMEREKRAPGNFILYLGKAVADMPDQNDTWVALNPCLTRLTRRFLCGSTVLAPKLGIENPPFIAEERAFLRLFTKPVMWRSLSDMTKNKLTLYRNALILLQYAT